MKKFLVFTLLILGLVCVISDVDATSEQRGKTYRSRDNYVRHHYSGLIKKRLPHKYHNIRGFGSAAVPNTLDYRAKDLSKTQDQKSCGSCYSFGCTSTAADALLLAGYSMPEVSAQCGMCCNGAAGCLGGYFDTVFDLYKKVGLCSAKEKPYRATCIGGNCTYAPVAKILDWGMVGDENNGPSTLDIENSMVTTGAPVAITLFADGPLDSYQDGIFNSCGKGVTNHITELVGFNNEGQTFNAKGWLPPGKGYWIMRNSWGADWGMGGFAYVRMTDSSGRRCSSIAEEAAYVIVSNSPVPTPTPEPTPEPQPDPCYCGPLCRVWCFLIGIFAHPSYCC